MDILTTFINRMKKLNIDVKLDGNYPWIYIREINDSKIRKDDYFLGNHGFTIAFLPIKPGQSMEFTDISKIFKLIRKYRYENNSAR